MTPTVRSDRLRSCASELGSELQKFNICSSFLCIVFFYILSMIVLLFFLPLITLLIMITFPTRSHFGFFSAQDFFSYNVSWMSFILFPSDTLKFYCYLTTILPYIYVWKNNIETTNLPLPFCLFSKVLLKGSLVLPFPYHVFLSHL